MSKIQFLLQKLLSNIQNLFRKLILGRASIAVGKQDFDRVTKMSKEMTAIAVG